MTGGYPAGIKQDFLARLISSLGFVQGKAGKVVTPETTTIKKFDGLKDDLLDNRPVVLWFI
jgi:hypothetical protein